MQPGGAAQAEFVICNQTIEYGFKHAKDEWAGRVPLTDAPGIERWWELVMCAYTLVSLQSLADGRPRTRPHLPHAWPTPLQTHPAWDTGTGWKHHLNNLRLLLQPYVCSCLLVPWLHLVPIPHLQMGLSELSALMNTVRSLAPT